MLCIVERNFMWLHEEIYIIGYRILDHILKGIVCVERLLKSNLETEMNLNRRLHTNYIYS